MTRLETPIFKEGDLVGKPDRLIMKLGPPKSRWQTVGAALNSREDLKDMFSSSDLASVRAQKVELLLWEKSCLGSVVWRFAVAVDLGSGMISAVGGESDFFAPVFFGGFIVAG